MVSGLVIAFAALLAPASAQAVDNELTIILRDTPSGDIARMRSSCALGLIPAHLARIEAAVGRKVPNAGAWCVTVLTRAGRDGTLGYVRDPRSDQLTPALAFDNGFVSGYHSGEALPANTPTMAALLPIAGRCLAQREPSTQLCNSAGIVLGARAARGELAPAH